MAEAWTKVTPSAENPTKKQKVYTSAPTKVAESPTYVNDNFQAVDNYVMNTSVHNEVQEGVNTRVVNEVQNVNAEKAPNNTWLRKGLQQEINDAVTTDNEQVVIPLYNKDRGDAVNAWYQTDVASTFESLAKSNKMDYEVKDNHAVAKVTENTEEGFFQSPAQASIAAYDALAAGFTNEQLEDFLAKEGYDKAETADILTNVADIAALKSAGYTDEDIDAYYAGQETQIANTEEQATSNLNNVDQSDWQKENAAYLKGPSTARNLVNSYQVLYPDMSLVTTNIQGFFGDREAQRVSDQAVTDSRARITDIASESGFDIEFDIAEGEWYQNTETGRVQITPAWYDEVAAAKGEIGGAVAGGATGAIAGGLFGGPIGAAIGGLGGSILGAAGGSQLDYMREAMEQQRDFEGEVMARKALNAAELDAVGAVLGAGVVKLVGSSWRGVKNAVNFARKNLIDRAATSLEEVLNISKDEAEALARRLGRIANPTDLTKSETELAAAVLSTPGAEELVATAIATRPKASVRIKQAITTRAQDVLDSSKGLAGEDLGRWLTEDLAGYKTLVKDGFNRVKMQAVESPRAGRFAFNYDKLAIEPVLERLQNNIENTELSFKFGQQATRIRNMSNTRSLGDLLDLRKLVNEFIYNKNISRQGDFDMLNGIKEQIDVAVTQGAEATMDKPTKWLKEWRESNAEYSKMKSLEKNVLIKAVSKPGIKDSDISKALAKYAPALDSTFTEVLDQLPKKTRTMVEGGVINNLAEKFAKGNVGGERAINFPALMQELDSVTFRTPEARSMKRAINKLSEVFRNDVPLAQATGGIKVEKLTNALTTSPAARAKYMFATKMFRSMQRLWPSEGGRYASLLSKTADVLSNPLNSKSIKVLQDQVNGDANVKESLRMLMQQEVLSKAEGQAMPNIKLFGSGKVLITKGKGPEHSVPLHRIATTQIIKELSENTGINISNKKALDIALREKGYMAAQLGADKVRLLE